MGGHAFGNLLGPLAVFPRMDKDTYERLREYVMRLLTTHFTSVAVAREDPAKVDFGDLDVVVGVESYIGDRTSVRIKDHLHSLLRAEHAVSNGPYFISFAIAASTLDTHIPKESVSNDTEKPDTDIPELVATQAVVHYQVDFNLAKDDDEIEAIPFYSSYGDLGMILSLVFKTVGMSYSKHGLKVCLQSSRRPFTDNHQIVLPSYTRRIEHPFHLSSSTNAILSFLKLDYDVWKAGFSTRADIYHWILSSHLAYPEAILGVSPKHLERPMYREFVRYTGERNLTSNTNDEDRETAVLDADKVVEEALMFFGKTEEYHELAKTVELRKGLKLVLNGKLIQEITGLQGIVVGKIIAQVKEMASPEVLILKSKGELRLMIEEAQRTLTNT